MSVTAAIKASSRAFSSASASTPYSSSFFAGPATERVAAASAEHSGASPLTWTVAVIPLSTPAPVVSIAMFRVPCPRRKVPAEIDQINTGTALGSPPVSVTENTPGSPSRTGFWVLRISIFGHGATGGSFGTTAGWACGSFRSGRVCAVTQPTITVIRPMARTICIGAFFISEDLRGM